MPLRSKTLGFSLIELMVVIAIVAILAGIALPSYRNYILKSTLRTAQADVIALSLSIENAYQRTLSYPAHKPAITTAAIITAYTSWKPASKTTEMTFSILSGNSTAKITDLSGNTVAGYVITATPVGAELSGCTISLDNSNIRKMGASASCKHTANNDWL